MFNVIYIFFLGKDNNKTSDEYAAPIQQHFVARYGAAYPPNKKISNGNE